MAIMRNGTANELAAYLNNIGTVQTINAIDPEDTLLF